ncbi:7618_t:CDS:1, partial [Funneliformis geosporum]
MATTTRNKHKQLAKEVERQRLVQEEGDDTDSDYKSNLSESEQEA